MKICRTSLQVNLIGLSLRRVWPQAALATKTISSAHHLEVVAVGVEQEVEAVVL